MTLGSFNGHNTGRLLLQIMIQRCVSLKKSFLVPNVLLGSHGEVAIIILQPHELSRVEITRPFLHSLVGYGKSRLSLTFHRLLK